MDQKALNDHIEAGSWRKLDAIATSIVDTARETGGSFFNPVLGGGTALMLALRHRVSDDIDLFMDSPGWIGHVTPRNNENFEHDLLDYVEESSYVKWRFDFGEIDFIVSAPLLSGYERSLWKNDLTSFSIEPVSEILAKKIFHRGWAMTPRDLFDWYAVSQITPQYLPADAEMARLVKDRIERICTALDFLERSPMAHEKWAKIRTPLVVDIDVAVDFARQAVARYKQLSQQKQGTSSRDCSR